MASFTDQIPQFNPYIEQLPVDMMIKVGLQKQAQYDQGVQKVQSAIDNVAGLDIYKDEHKNYLQSKLNQLGGNLTGLAAGDFSNFQLVNSVAGMTNQIIKDSVVQGAVSSTQYIRKGQKELENAIKKGTSSPSNKYVFDSAIQDYLKNPDLNATFNKSYDPYFDVWKFAKETFDSVKPGGYSWDEIYVTDPTTGKPLLGKDGKPQFSPYMIRHESEGRDVGIVTETLNQILSDPRVSQQLSIDGRYEYRGYDEKLLTEEILKRKQQNINLIDNKINELTLKKSLGQDVQSLIDQLNTKKSSIEKVYNNYVSSVYDNPDYIKSNLHTDDVRTRYTDMFTNQTKKDLVMDNPAANYMFKVQQEINQNARQDKQLAQAWRIHTDNMKMEKYKAELTASTKGKKGAAGEGEGGGPEYAPQESSLSIIGAVQNQITEASGKLQSATDEFIFSTALDNPTNREKIKNWKGTKQEAMSALIENAAKANGETAEAFRARWTQKALVEYNNTKSPSYILQAAKTQLDKATKSWNLTKPARDIIDPMFKDVEFQTVKNYTSPSSGKTFNITKEDMMDVAAVIKGENSSVLQTSETERQIAKSAKESLRTKGKLSLIDDAISANLHIDVASALGNNAYGVIAATTEPIAYVAKNPITGGLLAPFFPGKEQKRVADQQYVQKNMYSLRNFAMAMKNADPEKIAGDLKSKYFVLPVVKQTLMTGETKYDNFIKGEISRIASGYSAGDNQNASEDFDGFKKSMGDKDAIFDTRINPDGTVKVLVSNKDGEYRGSMVVQPQEASNLGLDVNSMFVSKEVTELKNFMNFNGGKSYLTNSAPDDKTLYINNDVAFNKDDFPALRNTTYDAKVNIVVGTGGLYYPYVYVKNDRGENTVINLPPVTGKNGDELERTIVSLKQTITPNYINAVLITK